MKTLLFVTITAVLLAVNADAQTVFLKQYGDENGNYPVSHVTDSDGNTFMVGNFYTPELQLGDITLTSDFGNTMYIAKIDAEGEVEWAFTEASAGQPFVYDIILDREENIVICGYFYNDDAIFSGITLPNEGSNTYLVKYTKSGDIMWAKSVSGNEVAFQALAVDDDNNILVGGSTNGALEFMGAEVEVFGEYDIIYAKYDQNGNGLWMKSFGSTTSDGFSEIAVDHEGNIFISCRYTGAFSIETFPVDHVGLSDALLMKTDSDGYPVWIRTVTGVNDGNDITGIAIDDDNHVYICTYASEDELLFGTAISNYGVTDVYTAKLHGEDGALLWYKFGGGGSYDIAEAIVLGKEGVYVTGTFQDAAEFDGLQLYSESPNGFIVVYSLDGVIVRVYGMIGNDFVTPVSISTDRNGHVYCVGSFYDNIIVEDAAELTTQGSVDIFLYKFASEYVVINQEETPSIICSVYPNPASEKIVIRSETQQFSNATVIISNITGQQVITSENINLLQGVELNISSLPAGMYTIQILENNILVSTGKFLKQ